jgi:transcriptional regulator with XRE-family HTH domain
MKLRYALGEVLRETRNEKFMTLRKLSEKSSVALGYISEVERGSKEASSEILECLAEGLNVDVADLIIMAGWRMKIGNETFDENLRLDLELTKA